MIRTRTSFTRPYHLVYAALGLVLACNDQPPTASDFAAPAFTVVTPTDPTHVLTVGVDAPANLTLTGTVAGIVVVVDNATLDLSKATVDCNGQTGPDPKIGVWIKNNRRNVYVKGGGTGVIKNCGIGVLIGPGSPSSGEPGGSNNHVAGLEIHASQAIMVSNSHDNLINSNRVPLTSNGISVIGNDPSAAASGKNQIYDNTIATGEFSIFISSDGNTIRGNIAAGMSYAAIAVDRDGNLISGNQTTALEEEDPPSIGIQLLQGADDNTIINNRLRAWVVGIDVEGNTARNIIRGNSATAENQIVGLDAVDRSGDCVNNTWAKNTFRNSDPPCIVGMTLDAVTFISPTTIQLEGQGATFTSTFTNHSTARLTDVAIRSWVGQGPSGPGFGVRRQSGWSWVSCSGTLGVFPRGTCTQVGGNLIASNASAGRGTLAVGSAMATIELVHIIDGDTVVVDSRSMPITLTPPASGSFWEIKAAMPTPRQELAVGVVNGILYAMGGTGGTVSAFGAVEGYDPVANSWTAVAPLPTPRTGLAAGVVNDVLYAVGGRDPFIGRITGAVEAYDPVANSWQAMAPMPTPRERLAVGVVNGVLYTVGGLSDAAITGVVEAYNPVTNGWTTVAPMPTPRYDLAVGVANGVLYAVGGFNNVGAIGAVEAYNPVTNSWTTVAPMPTPRFGLAVAVANGVLYAVGGRTQGGQSGAVESYAPAANSWMAVLPMPSPRSYLAVGIINNVVYSVGGFGCSGTGCGHVGAVEAYHP